MDSYIDILSSQLLIHGYLSLAPSNIAPVAEDLMGLYIIIFSGAILGGAKSVSGEY